MGSGNARSMHSCRSRHSSPPRVTENSTPSARAVFVERESSLREEGRAERSHRRSRAGTERSCVRSTTPKARSQRNVMRDHERSRRRRCAGFVRLETRRSLRRPCTLRVAGLCLRSARRVLVCSALEDTRGALSACSRPENTAPRSKIVVRGISTRRFRAHKVG
jgi:hypothetical protein